MNKAILQLETLTCPSCIKKIESNIAKQDGVELVKVLFNIGKVKVEFNGSVIGLEDIVGLIEDLGYQVTKQKAS